MATVVKGVGVSFDRNVQYRRTMEDAHCVVNPISQNINNTSLFCVFDGHGGKTAAEFAATAFPKVVLGRLV